MATQREYALLFKLQASLGSNFTQTMSSATAATKALQSSLSSINSTSAKIEGFQKQTTALESQKTKLSQLQEEYQRLEQQMAETGDETGTLQTQMERTQRQIEQTTERIQTQETRLNSLGDELRAAGVDTDNLADENARLSESYDSLRQSQERLAFISSEQQANNQAIAKTTSQLTTAVTATAAAGATVAATMIAPTMAFNQEMAMVGTLLDGTVEEVSAKTAQLGQEAVALSSAMGIDTSNVTDGLYQVISAYGETSESMAQLEMSSKAAVAGNSTVTDSVNLLSAVTKGYGDTSAEAQEKAADLAFQTVKLGQTSFPELASAMGSVIPAAAAMGVSQEELFGSMATLTGVTGTASQVTTQLNGVLQGFLSPSSDMQAQLEALGYASGAAMMESLGLQGSLETLKTAVNDDTLALGNLFGSSEAQKAIFQMVGEQAENLTEKTLAMSSATGAATEAFELMNNTDMAKWEQTKQTFQNLGIVIGQTLLPAITPVIEKVSELVAQFSDWAAENPETIATIVEITAKLAALYIGGLTLKLGLLQLYSVFLNIQKAVELAKLGVTAFTQISSIATKGLATLKNILTGVKAAVTAVNTVILANPVVAVIAVIVAAIVLICTHLEETRALIDKVFGSEGVAVFDYIVNAITSIGQVIKSVFLGDMETARTIMEDTFGSGGLAVFDYAVKIITGVGDVIRNVFLGDMLSARTAMENTFGPVGVAIFDTFFTVIEAVKQILTSVFDAIIQIGSALIPIFQEIFIVICEVLTTIGNVFTEVFTLVIPIAIEVVSTLFSVFSSVAIPLLVTAFQVVAAAVTVFADTFTGAISLAVEIVQIQIETAVTVFNGLVEFITGVFTGNWSQAWEGIKSIFSGVFEGIRSICSSVMNTIVDTINTVISGLNGLEIPDWVPAVGGMSLNIPLIPQFATGTNYTPDTFIAGEEGAELITGASGRKVFTAAQTGDIFTNIYKAQEMIENIQNSSNSGLITNINSNFNSTTQGNDILNNLSNTQQLVENISNLNSSGITSTLKTPVIPQFATGTNYTPDTFIAGEEGAELITGATGRKVFTAAQTGEIFSNLNRAQQVAEKIQDNPQENTDYSAVILSPELLTAMSSVQKSNRQSLGNSSETTTKKPPPPPEEYQGKGGGNGNQITITINSNPVFNLGSGGNIDKEDLKAMFEQYVTMIKEEIYNELESVQADSKRRAYD